jgi:hypothetical protein
MKTPEVRHSATRPPGRTCATRLLGACLLGAILFAGTTIAKARETTLGGQFRSLSFYAERQPATDLEAGVFSVNSLRLEFSVPLGESGELELAGENSLYYADPDELLLLPADSVNRLTPLRKTWNGDSGFADRLQLDRCNLRISRLGVDWTIGRQAVGFGRMLIFSPLDVIAPFSPDAIDRVSRPGVDALRAVRYFGTAGQIGGVAVLGDSSDHYSYLATFSANSHDIDLLGLAGSLRSRPMLGVGLAGEISGLGLKGEMAFYHGRKGDPPKGDLHQDFLIAGTELWYRFQNDLVIVTQYLFNGAGATNPKDYPAALDSAAVREGLSFLAGRHYLLLNPSWEIHPLVTLSGLLIWNMADSSVLLRPAVDWSLSDNLSLQFFYGFNLGSKPAEFPPQPRSEFGSSPDAGGIFLTFFF